MSYWMTSFEGILNCFKLINDWLNSKLCVKRKLLHSYENSYAFFVKKETLINIYFWKLITIDLSGNYVTTNMFFNLGPL